MWRGVVYAMLMVLGKVLVGAVLLSWPRPARARPDTDSATIIVLDLPLPHEEAPTTPQIPIKDASASGRSWAGAFLGFALVARGEIGILIAQVAHAKNQEQQQQPGGLRILSLEPYLVSLWAILLCTIVGPVAVGWIGTHRAAQICQGSWGVNH